jgi:hypothetical protein
MAAHYHHTWRRTMIPATVSLLALLSVLLGILATFQGERVPGFWLVFTPWVLSCGLAWIFSPLTVEVSGTEIRWYFGPGFWDYRVVLSDVESVRIVRGLTVLCRGTPSNCASRLATFAAWAPMILKGLPPRSNLQVWPEPRDGPGSPVAYKMRLRATTAPQVRLPLLRAGF